MLGAQGGSKAEERACSQAQQAGEEQHFPVHRDAVEARDVLRLDQMDPPDRREGKGHAQDSAQERQGQALDQELEGQAPSRGAHRDAHRDLLLARERSRQEQVRDVGAGDEEHERHRTREDQKGLTDIPDHLIEKRHDPKGEAAVRRIDLRMIGAQAARDPVHLGLGLGHGHTGPELCDDVVVLVVAVGLRFAGEGQGQEHLSVLRGAQGGQDLARQGEAFGQDSHHFRRRAVQGDDPADHRGIAAVSALPGPMIQDHDSRAARRVLLGNEQAPERRLHPQHGEKIRRDAQHAHPLRLERAGEVLIAADGDRHLLEARVAIPDVEVLSGREPVLRDVEAGRPVPQNHQALGVGVRQRPQEQRAGHAEDRGVGPDSDGDGDHRNQGKGGALEETPQGKANVLKESARDHPPASFTGPTRMNR